MPQYGPKKTKKKKLDFLLFEEEVREHWRVLGEQTNTQKYCLGSSRVRVSGNAETTWGACSPLKGSSQQADGCCAETGPVLPLGILDFYVKIFQLFICLQQVCFSFSCMSHIKPPIGVALWGLLPRMKISSRRTANFSSFHCVLSTRYRAWHTVDTFAKWICVG